MAYQSGKFLAGGAATTRDILEQVSKAGSVEAYRSTLHVRECDIRGQSQAVLVGTNTRDWGDDGFGDDEDVEEDGIRGRMIRATNVAYDRMYEAELHLKQKERIATALSHLDLSMPSMSRAAQFRQRVEQRRIVELERKEAQDALDEESRCAPAGEHDFVFSNGRGLCSSARGKASRVSSSRSVVSDIRAQLRGEAGFPLHEVGWQIRHANEDSPFSSCSCSGPLARSQVRSPFRDFVLSWVRENAACYVGKPGGWQHGGLKYTSLGASQLLFDLEVLERIRAMGVHISRICLIDPALTNPPERTRKSMQEFADWQRAMAQMDREEPAEILAFGGIEDFAEAAASDRADGCHLFLHCDGLSEGLAEDSECERLAMRSLAQGGLLARLSNAHISTLFSASAWTLSPGPTYQGGVDLRPISSSLLAACNDAISHPQVQALIHAQALALAKAPHEEKAGTRVSSLNPAMSGGYNAPKQTTPEAAFVQDSGSSGGVSQAQAQARARTRTREQRESEMRKDAAASGLSVWRVVHEPHVAVREKPRGTAKIVAQLTVGQEVTVAEDREGAWLRIASGPTNARLPVEAWVLSEAQGLAGIDARLLVPVA